MRILHVSIAALIYGALHQVYPQFILTAIEAAMRGRSSHWWGVGTETLLLAGISAACTWVLFRASGGLREASRLPDGRWLMGLGIALLLVWKFGALVVLQAMSAADYGGSASVGMSGDRLVGQALHVLRSEPVFWSAISLMLIGVGRAMLRQFDQRRPGLGHERPL